MTVWSTAGHGDQRAVTDFPQERLCTDLVNAHAVRIFVGESAILGPHDVVQISRQRKWDAQCRWKWIQSMVRWLKNCQLKKVMFGYQTNIVGEPPSTRNSRVMVGRAYAMWGPNQPFMIIFGHKAHHNLKSPWSTKNQVSQNISVKQKLIIWSINRSWPSDLRCLQRWDPLPAWRRSQGLCCWVRSTKIPS